MKKKQRKEHINHLLHKEIDFSLDMASDLAFDLLEDADVDNEKLEDLRLHFWMAKTSLDCLWSDKSESEIRYIPLEITDR